MTGIRISVLAVMLLGAVAAHAAQMPPACTAGVGYTPICGIDPAEDVELASDGKFLWLSTTPGFSDAHTSRLRLMELASHKVTDLKVEMAPQEGWGDATCAAPTQRIGAHGIHLSQRADGRAQLLVVNHTGREAVEFLEPLPDGKGWKAVWRGCVENHLGSLLNDVAATPEGGFVATAMFDFAAMKADPTLQKLLDGRNTGYLTVWRPGAGLSKVDGSEAPFPNGIQLSSDGRYAWFAAWTAKAVWAFDLQAQRMLIKVPLDFMPDNLSWSSDGRLLATGIASAEIFRSCFVEKREFCPSAFAIAAIDPHSGVAGTLYQAQALAFSGASVAVQVGADVYVGAFTGDRMLLLPNLFNER
jgi:hypothetical protein